MAALRGFYNAHGKRSVRQQVESFARDTSCFQTFVAATVPDDAFAAIFSFGQ